MKFIARRIDALGNLAEILEFDQTSKSRAMEDVQDRYEMAMYGTKIILTCPHTGFECSWTVQEDEIVYNGSRYLTEAEVAEIVGLLS